MSGVSDCGDDLSAAMVTRLQCANEHSAPLSSELKRCGGEVNQAGQLVLIVAVANLVA